MRSHRGRISGSLLSTTTLGAIGRSLIYRDAITFINACLIKWLPCFNLILPLANYHCTHTRTSGPPSALCVSDFRWGTGMVLKLCCFCVFPLLNSLLINPLQQKKLQLCHHSSLLNVVRCPSCFTNNVSGRICCLSIWPFLNPIKTQIQPLKPPCSFWTSALCLSCSLCCSMTAWKLVLKDILLPCLLWCHHCHFLSPRGTRGKKALISISRSSLSSSFN